MATDARPHRVRVLVADDHPIYREGIVRAVKDRPDLELVGEAGDGRDALEQIKLLEPDVAVLDIRMPGLEGTQVLSALKRDGNSTEVLFLSAFMEAELAYTTVAEGARGYLSKESSRQEICDAIVSVSRGDTALAPEVQSALAQGIMQRERANGRPDLSPRESEVLLLIAEGMSAPDIARQIHLSPTTVKTHLGHALREARRIRPGSRRGRGHEARPSRMTEADLRAEIDELRRRLTEAEAELENRKQFVAQVMEAEDRARLRIAQLIHDDGIRITKTIRPSAAPMK